MHNHKTFKFRFELEGEIMNKATATFTVNVLAGTQVGVITISPTTGNLPDETEGQPTNDLVANVSVDQNVVLPLLYSFTGQPDGVEFAETDNGDGTFTIRTTGTPASGDAANSPYTINLTVTDSAPASKRASASVRVLR